MSRSSSTTTTVEVAARRAATLPGRGWGMYGGSVGAVLVVDNYDSFVYNLVQYLGELQANPVVYRHDEIALEQMAAIAPDAVLISPGPGRPEDAGLSNDAI